MSNEPSVKTTSVLRIILNTILPVMLGVFLGLWANNWNEGRQKRALEKQVLQKIEQDIIANKNQLEEVIDYHKSLSDSVQIFYQKLSRADLLKPIYEMKTKQGFFWRGTRTGPLRDAGYQTSIVSGVLADLDFELVSLLSEVHREQENYEKLSAMYTESAINKNSQSKVIDYISFAEFFSIDISITEEKLINLYNIALKELQK